MRLYLNKTSPYARLALVVAHEAGLAEQIELVWTEPWDNTTEFLALNPLGKIPVLVTNEGVAIVESRDVCNYLLDQGNSVTLLPTDSNALRRLGLGWGAIDCAFGAVIRRRFKDSEQGTLSQRWLRALPRTALALEAAYAHRLSEEQPDLGDLAVAVAFSYCDFRLPEINWRTSTPQLASLVDRMQLRASFLSTAPE